MKKRMLNDIVLHAQVLCIFLNNVGRVTYILVKVLHSQCHIKQALLNTFNEH